MQTSTRLLSLFRARLGVRRAAGLTMVAALAALPMSSACTRPQDDNASSYLIVTSLNAASGNDPSHLGGVLQSDVISCVDDPSAPSGDAFCPANKSSSTFPDLGQAKLAVVMKNPTLAPTSANYITLTNYRVTFARTDGGTAVPAPFDSAVTVTVTGSDAQAGFILVPTAAKFASPLFALRNGGEINTVATVTFFGKDQAGRDIQATATIGVIFANWGG